jgi:hypothetical protein
VHIFAAWTKRDAVPVPDPDWRTLYRIGAVMAAVSVIAYILALGLYVLTTAPPDDGGVAILQHVHDHRTTYLVKQLLWVGPNLPMMLALLALAFALARVDKAFAIVAGTISTLAWTIGFAWPTTGEGSLAMVVLSDKYADATTEAERASLVAGAELLIALNDFPAVILGVLQTIGVLLLALRMLRSTFPVGLAWLGVATGAIGIVAEALRPLIGWAYAIYGLLLFAWLIWLAVELWRLGAGADRTLATTRSRRPAGDVRSGAEAALAPD